MQRLYRSNNCIVVLTKLLVHIHRLNDTYTLVCTESLAYRSNNFIVGLTNVSPLTSTPTLWNYTLCGQYPGAVPAGATVSLYCPYNLPRPFRYVIVQIPRNEPMNFCELEVFAPGTWLWKYTIYRVFAVLLLSRPKSLYLLASVMSELFSYKMSDLTCRISSRFKDTYNNVTVNLKKVKQL